MVTGKLEPCISFQKATAICHFFFDLSTYMYEIKALHCGKCFLLFVTHNRMFMF